METKIFKIPKHRPKRPLPPDLEKKAKMLLTQNDDEDGTIEAILHEGDPKVIIPMLTGEADCVQLAAEGECNPRAWTVQDVHDFLVKHELGEAAVKLEAIKVNGEALLRQSQHELVLRFGTQDAKKILQLVRMLKRVELGFVEKQKMHASTFCPPQLPRIRKVGNTHCFEIQTKRVSYAQKPDPIERTIEKEMLSKERFPSMPQGRWSRRFCFNCNKEGHLESYCPVPNSRSDSRSTGRTIICFRCQQEGHKSRACPQGIGKKICYKCRGEGHLAEQCTNGISGNMSSPPPPSTRDRVVMPSPIPPTDMYGDWFNPPTILSTPQSPSLGKLRPNPVPPLEHTPTGKVQAGGGGEKLNVSHHSVHETPRVGRERLGLEPIFPTTNQQSSLVVSRGGANGSGQTGFPMNYGPCIGLLPNGQKGTLVRRFTPCFSKSFKQSCPTNTRIKSPGPIQTRPIDLSTLGGNIGFASNLDSSPQGDRFTEALTVLQPSLDPLKPKASVKCFQNPSSDPQPQTPSPSLCAAAPIPILAHPQLPGQSGDKNDGMGEIGDDIAKIGKNCIGSSHSEPSAVFNLTSLDHGRTDSGSRADMGEICGEDDEIIDSSPQEDHQESNQGPPDAEDHTPPANTVNFGEVSIKIPPAAGHNLVEPVNARGIGGDDEQPMPTRSRRSKTHISDVPALNRLQSKTPKRPPPAVNIPNTRELRNRPTRGLKPRSGFSPGQRAALGRETAGCSSSKVSPKEIKLAAEVKKKRKRRVSKNSSALNDADGDEVVELTHRNARPRKRPRKQRNLKNQGELGNAIGIRHPMDKDTRRGVKNRRSTAKYPTPIIELEGGDQIRIRCRETRAEFSMQEIVPQPIRSHAEAIAAAKRLISKLVGHPQNEYEYWAARSLRIGIPQDILRIATWWAARQEGARRMTSLDSKTGEMVKEGIEDCARNIRHEISVMCSCAHRIVHGGNRRYKRQEGETGPIPRRDPTVKVPRRKLTVAPPRRKVSQGGTACGGQSPRVPFPDWQVTIRPDVSIERLGVKPIIPTLNTSSGTLDRSASLDPRISHAQNESPPHDSVFISMEGDRVEAVSEVNDTIPCPPHEFELATDMDPCQDEEVVLEAVPAVIPPPPAQNQKSNLRNEKLDKRDEKSLEVGVEGTKVGVLEVEGKQIDNGNLVSATCDQREHKVETHGHSTRKPTELWGIQDLLKDRHDSSMTCHPIPLPQCVVSHDSTIVPVANPSVGQMDDFLAKFEQNFEGLAHGSQERLGESILTPIGISQSSGGGIGADPLQIIDDTKSVSLPQGFHLQQFSPPPRPHFPIFSPHQNDWDIIPPPPSFREYGYPATNDSSSSPQLHHDFHMTAEPQDASTSPLSPTIPTDNWMPRGQSTLRAMGPISPPSNPYWGPDPNANFHNIVSYRGPHQGYPQQIMANNSPMTHHGHQFQAASLSWNHGPPRPPTLRRLLTDWFDFNLNF